MKRKLDCILLIDDEPADNFFHSRTIQKLDCAEKVIAKEKPLEALAYLKNSDHPDYTRPNLIFLDINMPLINGWEFLEQYEKLGEDLKGEVICIMLTTSINPSDEKRAEQYDSIKRYLPKPLSEADLMLILQEFFPDRF